MASHKYEHIEQVQALREVGRPIYDTQTVLTTVRRANKESSAKKFQAVLTEIQDYERQLHSKECATSTLYFRLELFR